MEDLNFEEIINENENNFLKETVDSKAIPVPKLLMKDQKCKRNPMKTVTSPQE